MKVKVMKLRYATSYLRIISRQMLHSALNNYLDSSLILSSKEILFHCTLTGQSNLSTKYPRHTSGNALGIWICECRCILESSVSQNSGCKSWCPKDLRVCAPPAPVLTHSLLMPLSVHYLCPISVFHPIIKFFMKRFTPTPSDRLTSSMAGP